MREGRKVQVSTCMTSFQNFCWYGGLKDVQSGWKMSGNPVDAAQGSLETEESYKCDIRRDLQPFRVNLLQSSAIKLCLLSIVHAAICHCFTQLIAIVCTQHNLWLSNCRIGGRELCVFFYFLYYQLHYKPMHEKWRFILYSIPLPTILIKKNIKVFLKMGSSSHIFYHHSRPRSNYIHYKFATAYILILG